MNIQACGCIKKVNEESTEFQPKKIDQNNQFIINENLNSIKTSSNLNLKYPADKTFSFSQKGPDSKKIKDKRPEIKIQTVVRAFLFRLKYFGENGLKHKLIEENKEIIVQKDNEFINDTLSETDKIIKKDLNDEFLLKLENYLRQKTAEFKIKTDCLVKKYLNGENSLYKGELNIEGKINGYGELFLKSGKKYEGIFIDEKLNGYGRLIDLFGIICYEGEFKDNQLVDGKGKIIKIEENGDKTIYEGDIKNKKKEGQGIEKNINYTYIGSFSDDLKHGKGKIIFNEGDTYEGDFLNGKLTGKGFYQWANKCSYNGEFLDGMMHGKGTYIYPNGNIYEGQFVNNLKEGFGEFTWKDGKKYKGTYEKGKPNGTGIITDQNGESHEAKYVNGKIVNKNEIQNSINL